MNRIGACVWSLPGQTVEEQLSLAQAGGLDGVQLDLYSGVGGQTLEDETMIGWMRDFAAQSGLQYPSLGVGVFCQHGATDRAQHPFLRDVLDAAIYAAAQLRIPLLQVPSFFASALNTQEDIANTIELMHYACEQAQKFNIQVGSENVLPPDKLEEFISAVNMPNFKIYFDTANPHAMAGLDAVELLDASVPYLAQVHLKDERDDGEPALLGEGDCQFQKTFAALKSMNYRGWYVLESPYTKVMEVDGMSAQEALFRDLSAAGYDS